VKSTWSHVLSVRAARSFSAKASSSPGCSCHDRTKRTSIPAGRAAATASPYLATLKVEYCGAMGSATSSRTPAAAAAASASAMNGRQLRIPTKTAVPPNADERAAACARVMSVSGERPPMAP